MVYVYIVLAVILVLIFWRNLRLVIKSSSLQKDLHEEVKQEEIKLKMERSETPESDIVQEAVAPEPVEVDRAKNLCAYSDSGRLLIKDTFKIAVDMVEKQKFEDAEICLEEICKVSKTPYYLMHLSHAQYSQERVDEAIHTMEEVLNIDENNVDALQRLGGMHLEINDSKHAKAYLERALQIEPENKDCLELLALAQTD